MPTACAPWPGKRILTELIVEVCTQWRQTPLRDPPLVFFVLDDGPTLVIAALGTNRVRRDGTAALRAVTDLAALDVVVGASLAASAVGVFSLGDSHRCKSEVIR